MNFVINTLADVCMCQAKERLDNLIKPIGSLGYLEDMVIRYAGIIQNAKPEELSCERKVVIVFGAAKSMALAEQSISIKKNMTVPMEINVILAETPSDALAEGAMLVEEFISEKKYQMVRFEVLDKEDITLNAVAGGMLQASMMGVPVWIGGKECQRALAIAKKKNPVVADYCFFMDNIQSFDSELGKRAEMEFNIFDAALKCYRQLPTFLEAGVDKPL